MKKLLYLFLALTIISCGGDDDSGTNEPQSFFEKYDGVVWEYNDPDNEDNFKRIQFLNQERPRFQEFGLDDFSDYQYCNNNFIAPIYGVDVDALQGLEVSWTITEELEDSFELLVQYNSSFCENVEGSYTVTVSVSDVVDELKIESSSNPNFECDGNFYRWYETLRYNRSILNDPCY